MPNCCDRRPHLFWLPQAHEDDAEASGCRRRQAPSGSRASGSEEPVSSVLFSRNAASYLSRPRLRSQTPDIHVAS
jgi:hypothetical protein